MKLGFSGPWPVIQFVVESSVHQKVAGSFPGQGTHLGCGFGPCSGPYVRQPVDISPPLSKMNLKTYSHVRIKKKIKEEKQLFRNTSVKREVHFYIHIHLNSSPRTIQHLVSIHGQGTNSTCSETVNRFLDDPPHLS